MATNSMNIFQRMSAITSELGAVKKSLNVGAGRSSYRAVSESDVLAAVKPLEAKYGIFSYPVDRSIVDSGMFTVKSSYNGNETERTQFWIRAKVVYRFVNKDQPAEYIDMVSYGDGIDTGDKAPGKAMTYADKYALLKAYKVTTGEDPDQYASPDRGYERTAQTQVPVCEKCGTVIEGYTDKEGKTWSAEKVAKASMNRYKKILCPACRAREEKNRASELAGRAVA